MRITVFGATGKVGRLVTRQLLADGHELTIFVHQHNPFAADDKLRVVQGDVRDAEAVTAAVKGSEVVISTLGSWHTPSKSVLTDAMRAIIPAMKRQGIERVVTLTGTGAFYWSDRLTPLDQANHWLLRLLAPKVLRDGEAHLRLLSDSNVQWTALRSPIMTRGTNQRYRLATRLPVPWATIPRRAVAQAIIEQLTNTDYVQAAPVIRRP